MSDTAAESITITSVPGVLAVGPGKPTDGSPVWFDTTDPEHVLLKVAGVTL